MIVSATEIPAVFDSLQLIASMTIVFAFVVQIECFLFHCICTLRRGCLDDKSELNLI